MKLKKDDNKKKEDKRKELQDFIARFSSNYFKITSGDFPKEDAEKITIDDIKPSSRRFT